MFPHPPAYPMGYLEVVILSFSKGEDNVKYSHGGWGTRLHNIWANMLSRCRNKNDYHYPRWGGRGITVCDEWLNFVNFRDWALNNGYEDNLSIDRIDNDGDYCPQNCRWATAKEQRINSRNIKLITYGEKTMCAMDWNRELGYGKDTIQKRLRKGWDIEEALFGRVTK